MEGVVGHHRGAEILAHGVVREGGSALAVHVYVGIRRLAGGLLIDAIK